MLTAYPASAPAGAPQAEGKVWWIDLLDPTNEERASVERTSGLKLPSRQELSLVESSSRVSEEDGTLFLSMPIVAQASALDEAPSPVGFVLSKDLLVTIRYTQLRSFDKVAVEFSKDDRRGGSVEAFAALVDEMIDLAADFLEAIGAELDGISRAVFLNIRDKRSKIARSNDALRGVLIDVGNAGARLSRIREILLGLQRIVPFTFEKERDWIPRTMQGRLRTAQEDLVSLTDYETHLTDKVQFLLDAVLGFINTRQNDIFQVLTVVAVVGIPPTLVASIYGMNFKSMPEYSWPWGYQYGLAMIVLSTVLPILWFKLRGWL